MVIRAYALCILLGIFIAVWMTGRRLAARGGSPTQAVDVAAYAVPFGIVGGRIYHVITTWQPYFGKGGNPVAALYIWHGGLGIWGAVALGALGAWIGCRRAGVSFAHFADSAAPAIAIAHAIGRWGNWFNNELYGSRTDLPWGLTIHQWDQSTGRAVTDAQGHAVVIGTFQPTFLYESVFLVLLAVFLLRVDQRRDLRPGQLFGLYVAGYPVGRIVIELMRTDEANHILGLRVNVWTSVLVFLLGAAIYRRAGRSRPPADAGPSAPGDGPPDQAASDPEPGGPGEAVSVAEDAAADGHDAR